MRMLVLSVAAALLSSTAAHCADVYVPPYAAAPPPYAAAPPAPPIVYEPPVAYGYPPVVAYGAPPPYVRPPGVIAAPEGPAYLVPRPAYQAGDEYIQQPVMVDARRYYRVCRWEFGYQRCYLRHKAWFW